MNLPRITLRLDQQPAIEFSRPSDKVRRLHQAYLNARQRHGALPIILIADGEQYVVFESDVYAVAAHCAAHIIPSLYHMAVVDKLSEKRLQDVGFEVRIVTMKGEGNERPASD